MFIPLIKSSIFNKHIISKTKILKKQTIFFNQMKVKLENPSMFVKVIEIISDLITETKIKTF